MKFNPIKLRKTVLDMAYAGSTVHIGCAFSIIELLAVLYRSHLRYPDNDPFNKYRDYFVLSKGHGIMAQYACMHELGWLSGSVYINVPVKSKPDSGNLVLRLDEEEHALKTQNSQESMIDVETGSLCLFPASLYHYTVPFEDKENRIVLAFDVMPIE